MPRKAPSQVIEHRISLSDFERKELRALVKSTQLNSRINAGANVAQSISFPLLGIAALVYVGFSANELVDDIKGFVDSSSDKLKGYMEKNGWINYQADEIGRQIAAIEKEQEELVAEMMLLGNTPGGMDSWQLKRFRAIQNRLPILSKRDDILRKMLNDIVTGERKGYTAYGGARSEELHEQALQSWYESEGGTDEVDWELDTSPDQ
tara:strand:- start:1804 stop:2424 length:621 start_codon:yes stop_codon:yes gene_type:complete